MAYPVLTQKLGEYVAHFKGTVVVQPKSTAILCGTREFSRDHFSSDKSV